MQATTLNGHLRSLRSRSLPDGGFAGRPGGDYRPDATAWAVLGLAAAGGQDEDLEAARDRLAQGQLEDGRVPISPEHPEAFWPTPLAMLAWDGSPRHAAARQRALRFLLSVSGEHWPKVPGAPLAHDTGLRGWPWVAATHSWVEPTALALLALEAGGEGEHPRAQEARSMLLDRQLPQGGWNYGNTFVFGQELHPAPESTGMALAALAGRACRDQVERSLGYLERLAPGLRSPLALGWSLLTLTAWNIEPAEPRAAVLSCLERQSAVGAYDTALLGLLVVAWHGQPGWIGARAAVTDHA